MKTRASILELSNSNSLMSPGCLGLTNIISLRLGNLIPSNLKISTQYDIDDSKYLFNSHLSALKNNYI